MSEQELVEGVDYIDLTPTWKQILPTWLMMYGQAVTGDCSNPDLIKENATTELKRMAEAADNFNDLVTYLRQSDTLNWDDEMFANAISIGRSLQETERTTVKEA